MNTVYDIGGLLGFGAVVVADGEESFHAAWERRVMGMYAQLRSMPGESSAERRAIIENLDAATYLNFTYYERALEAIIQRVVERGVITRHELAERIEQVRAARKSTDETNPVSPTPVPRPSAMLVPRQQGRPCVDGAPAIYANGDRVQVRNLHPVQHTRLPRYVRGRTGTVVRVNGCYRLEDTDKETLGDEPQPVYTVRFEASELWGRPGVAQDAVYVELWQGYLQMEKSEHVK